MQKAARISYGIFKFCFTENYSHMNSTILLGLIAILAALVIVATVATAVFQATPQLAFADQPRDFHIKHATAEMEQVEAANR